MNITVGSVTLGIVCRRWAEEIRLEVRFRRLSRQGVLRDGGAYRTSIHEEIRAAVASATGWERNKLLNMLRASVAAVRMMEVLP